MRVRIGWKGIRSGIESVRNWVVVLVAVTFGTVVLSIGIIGVWVACLTIGPFCGSSSRRRMSKAI